MGLISFIVLGALVGWIAASLLNRSTGLFMNIIIGIIGSFIGGFVSRLFTGTDASALAFSWVGLFWSLVGALILLTVTGALSNRHGHSAS